MIEVLPAGNAALMSGLLDKLGQGGAGRLRIYGGTRSDSAAVLVSMVLLAEPAGAIDPTTGALHLQPGAQAVVLAAVQPTWCIADSGSGDPLFVAGARLVTAPDDNQEVVVQAPDGFYAGALLQVTSGTLTA